MEWDPPDPSPIGENLPSPVEQPAAPAEGTVPPMHLTWPDHTIPAAPTTRGVRPDARTDDASAHLEDEDDDAYRGRPLWVLVVAVVLLFTFVGWAITSVASRI